jgi:hypothetical protein
VALNSGRAGSKSVVYNLDRTGKPKFRGIVVGHQPGTSGGFNKRELVK